MGNFLGGLLLDTKVIDLDRSGHTTLYSTWFGSEVKSAMVSVFGCSDSTVGNN